jgi:molybdate transport system substrate-binding protein
MARTVFLLILLLWARPVAGAEILVFAAASLTDALQEIARLYETQGRDRVVINLGASSVLARQIQEGARADLFISADEEKMDQLQERGLIQRETRRSLLSNRLVVVVERDGAFSPKTPEDLKNARRIAIAEPNTVPAGIYARRYLQQSGVWKGLNILPTQNVRGALAAVESGNAAAGIVYRTDAAISSKVRIAYEVPESAELKISYAAAVTNDTHRQEAAEKFLQHLQKQEAGAIFERHGFIIFHESSKP